MSNRLDRGTVVASLGGRRDEAENAVRIVRLEPIGYSHMLHTGEGFMMLTANRTNIYHSAFAK